MPWPPWLWFSKDQECMFQACHTVDHGAGQTTREVVSSSFGVWECDDEGSDRAFSSKVGYETLLRERGFDAMLSWCESAELLDVEICVKVEGDERLVGSPINAEVQLGRRDWRDQGQLFQIVFSIYSESERHRAQGTPKIVQAREIRCKGSTCRYW